MEKVKILLGLVSIMHTLQASTIVKQYVSYCIRKNNQLKGLLPLFFQYIVSISTYIKESLGKLKKKKVFLLLVLMNAALSIHP